MSCFIHSDKTYDALAYSLHSPRPYWFKKVDDWADVVDFARKLRAWNYQAYNERYNEEQDQDDWSPNLHAPLSLVGLYKLLQSVDYQCSDAREYVESQEGHVVQELMSNIAGGLVAEMPEYKVAKWSMDEV